MKTHGRKLFWFFTLMFLCQVPAFALHSINCSNEDGGLKRVEKEIWGANVIYWELQGEQLEDSQVEMMKPTKVIHEKRQISWMGVPSEETVFTVDVKLPDQTILKVFCKERINDALD